MNIRTLLSLIRNLKIKTVKKGEILIPEGSTAKEIYYVRKGLIRSYSYDDEKFEEITFQLYPEGNPVLNLHNILFDEPSKFIYQALEDTKLYSIDYTAFMELTSKNSDLLEINRKLIGRRVMRKAFQRVESLVFLSPEERYKKYIKDYPNLVNRVPNKYIANVLGITPVSLSRIRKRIASKKAE